MSKSNSSFKIPDLLIMTPDDVNQIIAEYLKKRIYIMLLKNF
jgi:hypothetical protein